MDKQLFNLGSVSATKRVVNDVPASTINSLILKHISGDWGDLCADDIEANKFAIENDLRILSKYTVITTDKELEDVYIITEHDRSYTTVMFVDEY